jgi:uncharacterized protein (DUF983 family)
VTARNQKRIVPRRVVRFTINPRCSLMRDFNSFKHFLYFAGFFAVALFLVGGLAAAFIRPDDRTAKMILLLVGVLTLTVALALRLTRDAIRWDRQNADRHRRD